MSSISGMRTFSDDDVSGLANSFSSPLPSACFQKRSFGASSDPLGRHLEGGSWAPLIPFMQRRGPRRRPAYQVGIRMTCMYVPGQASGRPRCVRMWVARSQRHPSSRYCGRVVRTATYQTNDSARAGPVLSLGGIEVNFHRIVGFRKPVSFEVPELGGVIAAGYCDANGVPPRG